ncbi:MAG TPA: PQQ-binding-like beta-propeller repeat protein [Armatimonadota bacterium]
MKTGLIALAILAAISAVRADDWPVVRHDPLNTGATAAAVAPPLAKMWTKTGATKEPIIVAGNTLLYTAKQGKMGLRDLVAIDAVTSKPLWTVKNVAQTGAASAALGLAFTVQRTSAEPTSISRFGANLWPAAIVALDLKTGKRKWAYPIGDHPTYPAVSPLTVADGVLYMVNIPYCLPPDKCSGSLIALKASNGAELARYAWNDLWNGQIGVVDGPPVVDTKANRIWVTLGYNIAPQKPGGQLWIFPAGEKLADGPIARLGDPGKADAAPASDAHSYGDSWPMKVGDYLSVQGPRAIAQSWLVTGTSAQAMWETRFTKDVAHSVLRGGPKPIVLEYNGGIRLLSAMFTNTAKLAWSKPLRATALSATSGPVVWVPAEGKRQVDGTLYALDTLTGKSLWSETRKAVQFNAPVLANGRLFVTDTAGNLTCYRGSALKAASRKKIQASNYIRGKSSNG